LDGLRVGWFEGWMLGCLDAWMVEYLVKSDA